MSETSLNLATTQVGDGNHRLVFLHGLMGRGRNFTTVAKHLNNTTSLLVDLPNHGTSPWQDHFDYIDLADTVAAQLRAEFAADAPVILLGHSLGGKVAMCLALRHPELLHGLVVEDISPIYSNAVSQFDNLLGALKELDLNTLESRSQGHELLKERIPNTTVRGFLLHNLARTRDGFRWDPNIDLLYNSLDAIGDFPHMDGHFDKPTLWIKGEKSPYITEDAVPEMTRLFPHVRTVTVNGSGHWVHSEKTAVFTEILQKFLDKTDPTPQDDAS